MSCTPPRLGRPLILDQGLVVRTGAPGIPPECLHRGTVNTDRHRALDQLDPDDQARGGFFDNQDALEPCQGPMGDADLHALHEKRMRVIAELVSDERADRLDLLLGDGHRLPIEAYQAGGADRCQYLELLLECKVAKEIA